MTGRWDAVVVGGGHNGLTAAAYLARAGRRVLVLEALDHLGGAAVSARVFPGVDARLSRYSYLVSLLPAHVVRDLGLAVTLRRRRFSSYAPVPGDPARGLLVDGGDEQATRASFRAVTGSDADHEAWQAFYGRVRRAAGRLFPTMTQPLLSRSGLREVVSDDATWDLLVRRPLGDTVEETFGDDVVRGVVLTDGLIGTSAAAADPGLAQNRCFLYHVVGGGTGDWDVPVGGMGAVSGALADAARAAGAELRTRAVVVAVDPGSPSRPAEVEWVDAAGNHHRAGAGHVLAGCAPATLARLLGEPAGPPVEGCQLKVNMLLSRLPRLHGDVPPAAAFGGTFHVNETATQLDAAHAQAAAGAVPALPPAEVYCHSLTDPGVLGPQLAAAGAATLTLFGLHLPARLFAGADHDAVRDAALAATVASLDSVLAEPLTDCLLTDAQGRPCLEVRSPLDVEADVGLPGGNIFQRPLQWPFAEDDADVGRWGTETGHARVQLAGAGARRGGGVSGIPGHNAAMAVLGR